MDESLYITVNGEESDGYSSAEIKTEDIVDYINSANDKKVAFIVNYDIKVGFFRREILLGFVFSRGKNHAENGRHFYQKIYR